MEIAGFYVSLKKYLKKMLNFVTTFFGRGITLCNEAKSPYPQWL
jgi:hypothetical protein